MKHTVTIKEWTGNVAFVTEATADDGRFLSLYAAPLPADTQERWVYTVDTNIDAGEHELRHVTLNIAYSKEAALTAVEEDARQLLRPTPRLEVVAQ